MGIFEGKLQFTFEVNQKILNQISEIDSFKGKWSYLKNENEQYLQKLKNITTIQSIGSSTRIEGATLSDKKIESKGIHPLIVVGLFVYEFLSIHPFHDGNGRLSGLLTTLLLLKLDYNFIKYVSFEHVIESRKNQYYPALMECQKDRNTSNETIGVWMIFFLGSLNNLSKRLEKKRKN